MKLAFLAAIALGFFGLLVRAQDAPSPPPATTEPPATAAPATTVFRTTVRRVVLDVIVTGKDGKPVRGLTKEDFSIAEDKKPQEVLSFDVSGFDPGMDYMPPKLPPEPVNTFVNLPTTPEKGPLYVLLYDLVNMDNRDQQVSLGDFSIQMMARQQMVKFIQSKPEGARFAIFAWSDGLHLVQGFTSDKALLLATVDPTNPRPHMPRVFMMGQNFGADNARETLRVLRYIADYLDGLPGRKNLIWFSGTFPLTLFPGLEDDPAYTQEIKNTLDMIAQDQIAIYPIDARGVLVGNPHAPTGDTGGGGMTSDARDKGIGGVAASAAGASGGTDGGQGVSLVSSSYAVEDEIARVTGGRTYHSNNDLAGVLLEATEDGSSYYTLTYSPSNKDYTGKLRKIDVELANKGYTLSYRRSYFGGEPGQLATPPKPPKVPVAAPPRKLGDTLYANMEHGSPIAHQLIFGAHIHTVGAPAMGTPQQMAELATQPAFFKVRHRSVSPKPLAPIELQHYAIDYTVMAHQLQIDAAPLNLELAAAAYDADGVMLNATVNNGSEDAAAPTQQPRKAFRAIQDIEVPRNAAWIRVAVRDANNDRIGAMEVKLPLAPENESAAAPVKTN